MTSPASTVAPISLKVRFTAPAPTIVVAALLAATLDTVSKPVVCPTENVCAPSTFVSARVSMPVMLNCVTPVLAAISSSVSAPAPPAITAFAVASFSSKVIVSAPVPVLIDVNKPAAPA